MRRRGRGFSRSLRGTRKDARWKRALPRTRRVPTSNIAPLRGAMRDRAPPVFPSSRARAPRSSNKGREASLHKRSSIQVGSLDHLTSARCPQRYPYPQKELSFPLLSVIQRLPCRARHRVSPRSFSVPTPARVSRTGALPWPRMPSRGPLPTGSRYATANRFAGWPDFIGVIDLQTMTLMNPP